MGQPGRHACESLAGEPGSPGGIPQAHQAGAKMLPADPSEVDQGRLEAHHTWAFFPSKEVSAKLEIVLPFPTQAVNDLLDSFSWLRC